MIGKLIDELIQADRLMWDNQELFYKIRHMTYEEFCQIPQEELYRQFKLGMDLNIDRNKAIDKLDEALIQIIQKSLQK